MKKKLLFLLLSVLTLGAWADDTYTPLEWIDYTGNDFEHTRACYYETGYTPNFNTRVEFLCQGYTDDKKWRAICYGRTSHTNGFSIYRCDQGNQFGYFVGGSVNNHVGSYVKNTNYRIVADVKSMLVNGINVQSTDRTEDNYEGPGGETMTLFSGWRDWPFKGRIYYFNIYEGNELKHAFVPVLKNGETPCFKCTVHNDYKEPHGSGFGYNKLTYTPVEYIEYPSDGAETPVSRTFDTGYVPNENTKVVTKFMANATGNWSAIFSGRNNEAGSGISLYKNGNDTKLAYFTGKAKGENDELAPFEINTDYVATCVHKKLTLNGVDYSFDKEWAATTRSITLFANPEKDQIFRGRIYYFDIYESDALKHHFIPVKASDNTVGFYDTVDKKYITTRTTTDSQYFTASSSWNGTDDAILPSFKYGGSYSAYTWTRDSGVQHPNNDVNYEHFNEIVGVPANDSSNKAWYATDYVPSSEWTFGNSVLPSSWSSNYGDIYVRRPFVIAAGSTLPSSVYMPTPHDDAPCEYYINGTLIWSRTGTEPSVDGWYQDEVVRLTDAQKALIKTDGTVNVFAFHVHQNWGGRYADGGLYGAAGTDGTPSKKFTDNADRRYLEETIALAESEGVDASIIDYGKKKQNFLQDASVALEKLRIARKRHYAERRSEAFVGSAPEAGKDYYLYNVGQRQFLGGGNDHGTILSLVYASNAMKLEADNGKFKINSYRITSGRSAAYVSSNGYIDAQDPTSFTFSETSSGSKTYTISYESGKYLGYKADTYNRVVVDNTDANSTDNHWKLISKAEFDELQNKATVSAPVDATYLISNPGYERGMKRGDWTYVGCNTEGLSDAYNSDQNYPDFVVTGMASGEMSVSRTLTGLKPGIYKVSVQACYRDGNNYESAVHFYNNHAPVRNAKLLANENQADIYTIVERAGKAPGFGQTLNASALGGTYPDTGPSAAEFFEVGQFWTSIDNVEVGSDGELTIAVKRNSDDYINEDWIAVDNWRLTYYGPNIASGEDYYFYNVGSDLWLQNNDKKTSEFTTRAELGDRGMNVGISAITGGYQLNPHFGNGRNHSINGSGLYMDTSQDVTAWQIASVSGTDYVTIKAGSNFLGSDGSENKYLTVSSSLSGNDSYWRMYTEEEYYNLRKTEMLTATQASPKDATWMITDPTFAAYDERETSWTRVNTGGNNDLEGDKEEKGGVKCNCVWEAWNSSSHSFQQELTNLPAGVYRMSVQGFYNSGANTYLPYYFVENTTSGKVQNNFMLASEGEHESTGGCATSAVLGGEDGQFWASKCIYEGHYQNPWIYFIVGSNNEETTIGVKKEGKNGEDWLVYDNFKLEYLGSGYEISFNENNTSIDEIIGLATRITMTRSMQKNRWNTFCVPFAMTGSQITEQFGSGSQVKELSGAEQNGENNYTMSFTNADAIVAGKPYMVQPANNVSSIELTNASGIAVNTTGTPSVTQDGVTFTGVYANGNAPLGSFIISNNNFYLVDTDTNSDGISEVALKAFRGYITVASGSNIKALSYVFDDDATAIEKTLSDSPLKGENIYNLAGQRLSKTQKGINIVNGKKVLK